MSNKLQEPLTDVDVDLRSFSFMPLELERLQRSKSWLIAKKNPEIGFYMVNLWCAAWHGTPAASLEDDDDVLADLAKCQFSRWQEVRKEALHGFIKCSDGRLYHPVVAEKALAAWATMKAQRDRTKAARNARLSNKINNVVPTTDSVTELSQPLLQTPEEKRLEEKKRKTLPSVESKESPAAAPRRDPTAPQPAAKKIKRKIQVPENWQPTEADRAYAVGKGYSDNWINRQAEKFINHHHAKGSLFLNISAAWHNWVLTAEEYATSTRQTNGAAPPHKPNWSEQAIKEYGCGLPDSKITDPHWINRLRMFYGAISYIEKGTWYHSDWGPSPWQSGCKAPKRLIDYVQSHVDDLLDKPAE